jgi:nucleoside-triphosphatase THEP1
VIENLQRVYLFSFHTEQNQIIYISDWRVDVAVKKNLFLEGNIRLGKSALIREILLPFFPKVGGIFVQRIFIGERYVAFKLHPIKEVADYRLNLYVNSLSEVNNLFLYSDSRGKWRPNKEVFENSGVAYLKESVEKNKRLILLDELGGVELGCPAFMEAVMMVLNSKIPVLGVLKSRRNAEKLGAALAGKQAGNCADSASAVFAEKKEKGGYEASFLQLIKSHPELDLLRVTENNVPEVQSKVKKFVERAVS